MHPRRLERREGIQLSYDLPHRLYTACIYPRRSRNGSSVIIYGHEKGLRFIWYGGRPFKQSKPLNPADGHSIDLTDSPDQGGQEYEQQEDEEDSKEIFDSDSNILTYHDISTSTACTHVTVLPSLASRLMVGYPDFLDSRIIVAVTGPDQSLQIISHPLDPTPKPTNSHVVSVKLSGLHQDLIQDIAITLTAELEDEEDVEQSRSGPRLHGSEAVETSTIDAQNWSLLVASISHTGRGLLVVHQIPISSLGLVSRDSEEHVVIQRCQLRSPFAKSQIKFSSSAYPAESHSYLSCTNSSGIKVFQTLPEIKYHRQRRSSSATIDSTTSTTRFNTHISASGAKPLITLLSPFASRGPQDLTSRRKQVLDSAWVLNGRAVLALLEDGEWGVWDLQAAGPSSHTSSSNLVKGQKNIAGIHGGSLTMFATGGHIQSASQVVKKSSSKPASDVDQALAPMTPHTRKTRSGQLFNGSESLPSASSGSFSGLKGSVSIVPSHEGSDIQERINNDTIIFTFGTTNMVLNSLQSYWRSGLGGRSVFDNVATNQPVTLPTVLTPGEESVLAQLLPSSGSHTGIDLSISSKNRKLAVFSATRMFIFSPRSTISKPQPAVLSTLPARLAAARSDDIDQVMLEAGELSLDGVDRMLESMAQGTSNLNTIANPMNKKQVGFQVEDDDEEDVEMENSPTVSRSARSKLMVGNQPSRQLFT